MAETERDRPGGGIRERTNILLGLVQRRQNGVRVIAETLSSRSQADAAGFAFEELHAKRSLDLRDVVAQGRLCDVQVLGGAREGAGVGDRKKVAELTKTQRHASRPILKI